MSWYRDIDRWFADQVFIHRAQHFRYALKLSGNPSDAEDLVQEAYAKLFAIEDWARISNPHAFTMRIIHNVCIERMRSADFVRMDRSASILALDPASEMPSPEDIVQSRAELFRVVAAMETLPPRSREALRLRRIDGLPPGKVAEKMGIAVSTAEKHLAKGIRLLFERLKAQEENGADGIRQYGRAAGVSRKAEGGSD